MIAADRSWGRGARRAAVVAGAMIALGGCSHIPGSQLTSLWHHQDVPAPQAVHEVTIESGGTTGASFPQYWKRNTLLIDLQGASGSGHVVLRPIPAMGWPVRLAFRVMPGQFGELEVRADERVILPITAQGAKPVDLELSPGVYTPRTPQITVSWEPQMPQPASGDR